MQCVSMHSQNQRYCVFLTLVSVATLFHNFVFQKYVPLTHLN